MSYTNQKLKMQAAVHKQQRRNPQRYGAVRPDRKV